MKVTAALEADSSELRIISSLFCMFSFLFATVACFMRRSLTRISGYFEEVISAYLSGEFKTLFRMPRETFELFSQDFMQTGRTRFGNSSGRSPIPQQKQILIFLWAVGNREPTRTIAVRFDVTYNSTE